MQIYYKRIKTNVNKGCKNFICKESKSAFSVSVTGEGDINRHVCQVIEIGVNMQICEEIYQEGHDGLLAE